MASTRRVVDVVDDDQIESVSADEASAHDVSEPAKRLGDTLEQNQLQMAITATEGLVEAQRAGMAPEKRKAEEGPMTDCPITGEPRYCCDINRTGLMASTRRDVKIKARELAVKLGVRDGDFAKFKVLWRCVPVISSPSASSGSACLAQRRCVPRIEGSLWSCTLLCTRICTNGN